MKKINILLLLLAALCSTTAVAEVVFDETNFPDECFRELIKIHASRSGFDLTEGDMLTEDIIEGIDELDSERWDIYDIESIEGIQYLTALESIFLPENRITSVKGLLNDLPGLVELCLIGNLIDTLDLHDSNLSVLQAAGNPLKYLNVRGCYNLGQIFLKSDEYYGMELRDLDLRDCLFLQDIYMSDYYSADLDLSYQANLQTLSLDRCHLTTLDVSYCRSLQTLVCTNSLEVKSVRLFQPDYTDISQINLGIRDIELKGSGIESIDISNQQLLRTLNCNNCPHLTSITAHDCPALIAIKSESSNLHKLDVVDCDKILDFFVSDNHLTSFDLGGFGQSLVNLKIQNNHLNAIDFTNMTFDNLYVNISNNGRQIQVYSTSVDGEKQYFIPLTTTADYKGIKDLIEQENNFEEEDTGFDWANVVTESLTGASLGELDGEAVLWLDKSTASATEGLHRMTYQYLTHCPNEDFASLEFYLDWAEETAKVGDVNNDGNVTISDVTALIDYLLSGDASGINLENADVDSNDSISISDVTALIDILLSSSH